MENLDRVVVAGDGFAPLIPGQRESRPVTLVIDREAPKTENADG